MEDVGKALEAFMLHGSQKSSPFRDQSPLLQEQAIYLRLAAGYLWQVQYFQGAFTAFGEASHDSVPT